MITSSYVTIKTNEPYSSKTDRKLQCNEQRRMNGLVEIAVAEVAGLQLYKLKIHSSCGLAVMNSLLCTFDHRILSYYLFATSLLPIF